jgi:hypothetical protein
MSALQTTIDNVPILGNISKVVKSLNLPTINSTGLAATAIKKAIAAGAQLTPEQYDFAVKLGIAVPVVQTINHNSNTGTNKAAIIPNSLPQQPVMQQKSLTNSLPVNQPNITQLKSINFDTKTILIIVGVIALIITTVVILKK